MPRSRSGEAAGKVAGEAAGEAAGVVAGVRGTCTFLGFTLVFLVTLAAEAVACLGLGVRFAALLEGVDLRVDLRAMLLMNWNEELEGSADVALLCGVP